MQKKGKAEYRSSLRSKELIRTAFSKMLQKKPVEKITVTDIVSAANINRGTFYAHYSNINELILSIQSEFCSKLCGALEKLDVFNQETSVHEVISELTAYLEENRNLCKELLILGKTNSFALQLQNVFTKYMEQNLKIDEDIRRSPGFKVRARFFSSAITGVYAAYLNGEIEMTPEELNNLLSELIMRNSLFA